MDIAFSYGASNSLILYFGIDYYHCKVKSHLRSFTFNYYDQLRNDTGGECLIHHFRCLSLILELENLPFVVYELVNANVPGGIF